MSGGDWKEMFRAIQSGDINLVEYYLKIGIDPNYQHPEFLASPLLESIRFDQFEITKLLLENDADPEIKEIESDETPLSVAQLKANKEVIALLKSYIGMKKG